MGDRANVVVRDTYMKGEREAVFLYSHWGGTELPEDLRVALARRERWDDSVYLARIVFETMIGDERMGGTGFGISTRIADNEYDLLVLMIDTQTIVRMSENHYRSSGFTELDRFPSISFEDYIAAAERTWDNLTNGS